MCRGIMDSMKTFTCLMTLVSVCLSGLVDQTADVPFHRGVNLTGWFQPDQAGRLPFSRFGEQDFRNLSALGVEGIRLPVNFAALVGPGPQYTIDPRALAFLDEAIKQALASGFKLVLDNHSDPLDPRIQHDLEGFLKALWNQLALHYVDWPTGLLYEIQNEPHKIGEGDWARIQEHVLQVLRVQDAGRLVVVTGADWGSLKAMTALPRYADKNLIYTFHFYDPFVFTHQGAGWTDLKDLSGVAFPPKGKKAPDLPASLRGNWLAKSLSDYYAADPVPLMARTFDQAAAFARERGVPIWCGELGVYNLRSDPADRVAWYRTVRGLLEDRGIPWTSWDYKDTFGLFQKGSAEVFEQDLNLPLVQALGFNVPAQVASKPDRPEAGFFLYQDTWQSGSHEGGYNHAGNVDYFSAESPHEGKYSVKVSGIDRYANVAWNFAPWKDLSALSDRASLLLWVRSSAPKFSFDFRFVDGQVPGADGLPWRISKTVDQALVPGDRQWHLVQIPLSSLKETGAWDGKWHEPKPGTFAWNRVASFEIVAEQSDLHGVDLWFDDIEIR